MHSGRLSKLNMILRPLPLIGIRIRLVVAFQIIEKANFQKDGSSKASNECGGITQKEEVRSNSVLPTVDISIGHKWSNFEGFVNCSKFCLILVNVKAKSR